MTYKLLFPHDDIRSGQKQLIDSIKKCIESRKSIIAHAPTGLGKTAASLAPSISYAIENDKTVIFLTSRHTQHMIALETVKKISDKHNIEIPCINIIGKKWMCLQENVEGMYSSDFSEYCKSLKENKQCKYFENLKKEDKLSTSSLIAMNDIINSKAASSKELKVISNKHEVCPYEIAMIRAKKAKVIVTDYYYVFHPNIRENFFNKLGKSPEDCIVIVDEGHNLPNRIKDLATARLTTSMINRAVSEAKKFTVDEDAHKLKQIGEALVTIAPEDANEAYISKDLFMKLVSKIEDYENLAINLEKVGEAIREQQRNSAIGGVGSFLSTWLLEDKGFSRILSRSETKHEYTYTLSYRCLDPSVVSGPIINEFHSCILMSGTLTPTSMYKELLGINDCEEVVLKSPFPEKNKLNIIIPETSTKYSKRSDEQFADIAKVISRIVSSVPGNCAVFLPSYYLKEQVERRIITKKSVFSERSELTKDQKDEMLEKFKSYKDKGALLMGVTSGNFGEGIDLPGDYLKCVIIVGLPLQKPDLEAKALIEYYDFKFSKGWDYGYVFPAFSKTLQSAGRCIRSETDRGVIVFLDERYAWPNYYRCFPESWNMKISRVYETLIRKFFGTEDQKDDIENFDSVDFNSNDEVHFEEQMFEDEPVKETNQGPQESLSAFMSASEIAKKK